LRLFIRAALRRGRTGGRAGANGRRNGSPRPTFRRCGGLPPESDYRFKHALIQNAAYEHLLKSRRQVLNRRVGEVLRDQFAAGATDQIATLPPTPALRRKQVELQVALINSLMHVKGQTAPEIKVAVERARLLIEQAEALGEPPRRSTAVVLGPYGFRVANFVAFNGDVMRELAAQFLTLAEKQGATAPLLMAHRFVSISVLYTGDIAEGPP
jgi:hypothetical protein